MKKKRVLLTIPHAKCGESGICDKDVLKHAENLKNELDKLNITNKMIIGNIERTKIDLNRKESKQTDFQKRIDKELDKIDILLDIHSFYSPNRESAYFLKLDNRMDNFVKCTNIDAKDGSKKNYIMDKAIRRGKKSILIEFNSSLNQKNNYRKIADCIKDELEPKKQNLKNRKKRN